MVTMKGERDGRRARTHWRSHAQATEPHAARGKSTHVLSGSLHRLCVHPSLFHHHKDRSLKLSTNRHSLKRAAEICTACSERYGQEAQHKEQRGEHSTVMF